MPSKISLRHAMHVEIKYTFTNIKNVPLGGGLISEKVKVEDSLFWLTLYPNGYGEANKDFISLYLEQAGPNIRIECCTFKIFKPVGSSGSQNDYISPVYSIDFKDTQRTFGRLTIASNNYIGYNSLTVECSLIVFGNTVPLQLHDFSALCFSDDFSDVCFKVENQTFPAHKMLLGLHSPVFKAMLQSGMTEATSNEIAIDDYSGESFKAFLTCLYSQSISLLNYPYDICVDICKLSDKYQVVTLQSVCFLHLEATMNIETCIDLLCLCHTYEWTQLKDAVIKFIAKNKKLLLKSQITALKSLSDDLFHEIVNAM